MRHGPRLLVLAMLCEPNTMKNLLTILLVAAASAQPVHSPLKGVWKVTSYIAGDGQTYTMQPGLYIFTEKYFSIVATANDKPRPDSDPSKATDAEIVASWRPLIAQSGTYEISGRTVTMHPTISKIPSRMRPDSHWTFTYQLDGDTLFITLTRTPDAK